VVQNETYNYRVTVENYDNVSTAGDVLSQVDGEEFTTKDRDHDVLSQVDGQEFTTKDRDHDVLSQVDGQEFTTKDRDHDNEEDINCAQTFHGGFWYNRCDREQVTKVGITASGNNFVWGDSSMRLHVARMYLTCP